MRTKALSFPAAMLLVAFSPLAHSRPPITPPTYAEMMDQSDLVCVLRVKTITESPKPHPNNPYPEKLKSYLATCKVMGVFKGDAPKDEIRIPFYGHLLDLPNFHFPAPLVETTQQQHEWVEYLAFLKRGKDGLFVPALGDKDAGLCFSVLFSCVDFDVAQLLRQRQAKPNEGSPANRGQPIRSQTNSTSSATGSRR